MITLFRERGPEILQLAGQHLTLVLVSTALAVALGLPLGVLLTRRSRLARPILALAGIVQTVPSLALFGFLIPLPFIGGIGPRTAVIALVAYALLPILRNTYTGIRQVDPAVREAATGLGMTDGQRLRMVELPLALPVIVAGIRVAAVVGVGTATIAAAIGAGGLGTYVFRGIATLDTGLILAGAIPAAALALIVDALLAGVERSRRPGRAAAALAIAVGVTVAALRLFGGGASSSDTVLVGSKNFTEQVILGELLAQTLERRGIEVTRRLNLGGTFICDQAIRAGDIDAYVEYTGTALTAILKQPVVRDAEVALTTTRELYARSGLSVLAPLGFNNTFAILVRRADAAALGLRTIGDLQAVSAGWTPGFGYEFVERADGYRGLTAAYGLRFAREPRVMELTLMYRALANEEVDVVAGDATSALIEALDLTQLDDDRAYFPPYHAVPVVRSSVLLRFPEVRAALEGLAGRISEQEMRTMNHAVDVERRDVAATVREFLDRQEPG